jgi:hypothetical protein
MRRTCAAAAAAFAFAFILSACKDSGSPGIASVAGATPQPSASRGDDEQARRQFTECMSQHGVTMSDPHTITPPSGGRENPALQKWLDAYDACRPLLPGEPLQQDGPGQAEMEQLRAFAVCMREHDIPMTDPLPNGNMKINGRFEHGTRAQMEADPVYIAAIAACHDKLPDNSKSAEPKQ